MTRDEIIKHWQFKETVPFVGETGSGYPADPNTKKWLEKNFTPIFAFPTFVRFSWQTTKTIITDKGLEIDFEYEKQDKSQGKLNF